MEKICKLCGTPYFNTAHRSLYCSTSCKNEIIYSKRKEKRTNKPLKYSNCIVCFKEFVKTREDKVCCSQYCNSRKYRAREKIDLKDLLSSEVSDFLSEMRRKAHWADMIDIFILIDIHDRVYPSKNFNDDLEKEIIFSIMYNDLKLFGDKEYKNIEKKINPKKNTERKTPINRKEYTQLYYQKNKEEKKEYFKEYYEKNKEKKKSYYEENKEKIKQQNLSYYYRKKKDDLKNPPM